ncbi:iron complex transport system ATP-binding protein [Lebetimonas natsushimae]|uniref:Iron complex transport system ATP-binding protein n=1 Tax=Lebetimonas natsushimae TaxID=1936991 RepID=A0A292YHT9_9BACT|nr:ABC transporter ATP-binding protein [Lebetimonas natsushimae]GAX88250.1 iron complex transport system ATP-binding protein [Lebetimonas natsushimae]
MIKLEGVKHLILDIEDLEISDNSVILGPNGSGKSILLKIITHEIYPQNIKKREVFGKKITLKEARKIFGIVNADLEYFYKNEHISVFDAIISSFKEALVVYNFFKFSEEEKEKTYQICKKFDLNPNQDITTLSLGEIKKVLIARAVIHNPKILCLDEPTNGLDIKAKKDFWDFIETLNKKIILITHDFYVINNLFSKIIMLNNGKIFKTGNKKILTKENLSKLFNINKNLIKGI